MKQNTPLLAPPFISNTLVNISQVRSFQYFNCFPQAISSSTHNLNQFILPFQSSHEINTAKSTTQIPHDNASCQTLNNENINMKPNIIINYTIINNYIHENKKKKQMKIIDDEDDTIDSNKSNDLLEDNAKIDEFLSSIKNFVKYLEMNDGEQSIMNPSLSFGISRRRLYDVINVFESIGCCKKHRCDSIFWIGQSNIKNKFKQLVQERNIDNFSLSLEDLFPSDKCIGVSNMTTSLILLFYALKVDKLDLRDIANFFSRQSPRYKTTLNKLYQIAHIMSAIEIIRKTQQIGEVILCTYYFDYDAAPEYEQKKIDYRSIESFLNTNENKSNELIQRRRREFNCFISRNKKR